MKTAIGYLDFYIPNKVAELEAIKKVKNIVEITTDITDVKCRDIVYAEMRFTGMLDDKVVWIIWNYHNGEISYS